MDDLFVKLADLGYFVNVTIANKVIKLCAYGPDGDTFDYTLDSSNPELAETVKYLMEHIIKIASGMKKLRSKPLDTKPYYTIGGTINERGLKKEHKKLDFAD